MKQLYALPDNRTEEEKEQDFISSLSEGLWKINNGWNARIAAKSLPKYCRMLYAKAYLYGAKAVREKLKSSVHRAVSQWR